MVDSPNTSEHAPELLTPGRVLAILRKHVMLVLACCVCIFAVALFWSLGQSKIYRSEALVRLDPDPPKPLGARVELVQGSASSYWNHREFYESEYRIMRSMRVAAATVTALGLNADPNFLRIKASERAKFKPVSVKEAAEILISRLVVEPVKDSSLVNVRYEDTNPQRAQVILNAVLRSYLSQNVDDTTLMSTSALEWLTTQLEHLKIELEKSEIALNDFRQKNNVLSISLEDRHNMITAQLEQLAKSRTDLEVKRKGLSAHAAELDKIAKNPEDVGATQLLENSLLTRLREDYNEAKRDLDALTATHGENYNKVKEEDAKVETLSKAIRAEVQNVRNAAHHDVNEIDRQISEVKKTEDDLQRQAHELQAFEVPYSQLARTKEENAKIYGLVLERTRETELTRVMHFNNVRVIDDADLPGVPYKPNTMLNLTVGLVIGILVGLAAAVAREFLDRSLKTPLDVESFVLVPCLGLLPDIASGTKSRRRRKNVVQKLLDRDLIAAHHPEGGVAEAARAIRTNLRFMSPDRPYHSLLVTSAVPEEGKTTVACSLATVLAQSGLRVLLVDTDLRRPRLHRTFQLPNDLGVTMVISNQATLEECIRESSVPNVWVLTSGPIPPNPAEILQSDQFEKLTKELSRRFDRVVFDSPPILPVTDAAVLSRTVDGVVVVGRAFRTPKTAARQAVRQLRDVKAHVIGLVLNAVDLDRSDYNEYHYYYKRDGYYSSRLPSPTAASNGSGGADSSPLPPH